MNGLNSLNLHWQINNFPSYLPTGLGSSLERPNATRSPTSTQVWYLGIPLIHRPTPDSEVGMLAVTVFIISRNSTICPCFGIHSFISRIGTYFVNFICLWSFWIFKSFAGVSSSYTLLTCLSALKEKYTHGPVPNVLLYFRKFQSITLPMTESLLEASARTQYLMEACMELPLSCLQISNCEVHRATYLLPLNKVLLSRSDTSHLSGVSRWLPVLQDKCLLLRARISQDFLNTARSHKKCGSVATFFQNVVKQASLARRLLDLGDQSHLVKELICCPLKDNHWSFCHTLFMVRFTLFGKVHCFSCHDDVPLSHRGLQ